MTANSLSNVQGDRHLLKLKDKRLKLQKTQEKMYSFLLRIVKSWQPDEVLKVFKRSFIDCLNSEASKYSLGIYIVLLEHNEEEFRHTIKRCCYILINNWESTRKHKYIRELVELFVNLKLKINPNTPVKLRIARTWVDNFAKSTDYEELKLFAYRNEEVKGHWVNRYSSYLLFAQSLNDNSSQEEKEAARKLYRVLKDKFKFELAMYLARSQLDVSNFANISRHQNPSSLGDNVIRLIKAIVVKKGDFSYENVASIFLKQTQNELFHDFKKSLLKYLIFSVQQQDFTNTLQQKLSGKLNSWKVEHDDKLMTKDILLRVCNKTIDFLTTENGREPSKLFVMLLSQGNPLTLVVVLLKIIFISNHSRSHLEMRIANLISYYNRYLESECSWFINFIEIFNITFAIYAENVEYNLIKMKEDNLELDDYRVFSQLKTSKKV
jgi:hypothetical protein